MTNLEQRALSAYFKNQESYAIVQQPQEPDTVEVDGKKYIVLSNVRGILAVYRVKPDGFLKRLKRWPSELDESFGG